MSFVQNTWRLSHNLHSHMIATVASAEHKDDVFRVSFLWFLLLLTDLFSSVQFICPAHFYKLKICLRVLYNLYIYTSQSQNFTSDQEKLPNNPSRC